MNPDEGLSDILDLIKVNHTAIDLLMVTGDMVNEPSLPAYRRIHKTLSANIQAPFAWLPGNHDDLDMMLSFDESINLKCHVLGNWVMVMLNSRVEGHIYGYLSDDELSFLGDVLARYSDHFVIVCLHHQPVPIGSEWMDNYIVRNADAFWSVIDSVTNVKAVVWGHVHQEFVARHKRVNLFATPSTSVQFTPGQKHFHVDKAMPGYRWFELHDYGHFQTGVERVDEKDYGIDFSSHGY